MDRAFQTGIAVLLGATLVAHRAAAEPSVWMIDDGEKIRRDAVSTPFESGEENPVWQPGEPAHFFAVRNETVAFQVVVEADGEALDGVTVDLEELVGPEGAKITAPPRYAGSGAGQPIERFVEHFVEVRRASRGAQPGASRGWELGSGPPAGEWVGPVPDALIPVDLAPSWAPYPMAIEPATNGIVWIDVEVPRDQAAGLYRGRVVVRARERVLGLLPVELEVAPVMLPDRTVATALAYDQKELVDRVGPGAEAELQKLLHRHRIAPLGDASSAQDVIRLTPALSGSLYTRSAGYVGPAPGMGDGVVAVGAPGEFGAPDDRTMTGVRQVANMMSSSKLFGGNEAVFFAADEQCSSSWGSGWRQLLRTADDDNVRRIRVGWTCTQDPTAQPVDIPMMRASFDAAQVKAARAQGKEAWVYDGTRPRTGSFLIDDDAISPRVNGFLSAMFRIPRWYYPSATRWYAEHGDVPIDPFDDPESSLGEDDAHANGDGMLLYPGMQRDAFEEHSLGFEGVLASVRLKNWRRGVEDAGYLQMAHDIDPVRADQVARRLVPAAFDEARGGEVPSWGSRGKAFFEARRALLAIIVGREAVTPARRPQAESPPSSLSPPTTGCSRGVTQAGGGLALSLMVSAMVVRRFRRPKPMVAE